MLSTPGAPGERAEWGTGHAAARLTPALQRLPARRHRAGRERAPDGLNGRPGLDPLDVYGEPVFVVSVGKGQEVIETVAREAGERGVRDAAIVSLIGAVESCCVSVMPKDDPSADILTEYDRPFEMSGTGEIRDGRVHIHCVM